MDVKPSRGAALRTQALLFVALFGTYAYFFQGGGWNENSRLDMTRALVERGSVSIDAYHLNTFDKSRRGLHFYSDKAPGAALLAMPIHAAVLAFSGQATDKAAEHALVLRSLYLVTLLLSGAVTAATAVLVMRMAVRAGTGSRAATVAALAYGVGTLAFPVATIFFSHALAAFLLFLAFTLLLSDEAVASEAAALGEAPPDEAPLRLPARFFREVRQGWRPILAGLASALAVLCEYPLLPAVGILALAAFLGPGGRRRAARFGLAGALPAVVLLIYLAVAFGNPFRTGYQLLADPGSARNMDTTGFIGLTAPKMSVIVQLLFSSYRGLFYYCPVLFLGALGMLWAARRGPARKPILVSAGLALYFVLFVSSYAWWEGGSSFGSRHLVPMLPFLCWPMAFLAVHVGWLVGGIGTISAAIALVVTAVQPKPAAHIQNPFFDYLLPSFRDGKLARNNVCPLYSDPAPAEHRAVIVDRDGEAHDAWNLGQRMGAGGLGSLGPLMLYWALAGAGLAYSERRRGASVPARSPPPTGAAPPSPPAGTPSPSGSTAPAVPDNSSPPAVPGGGTSLAVIAVATALAASACHSGPPPGTPLTPSPSWLVATNCTETGRPVPDGEAVARMMDPPGVRACGFAGRFIAVRPGVETELALEVHDPFPDAAPAGLVEQRLYVDGRYVWAQDLAADTFTGWRPVRHRFKPSYSVVELRVEVATRGMEDPGGNWGSRTASAVRGLTVTPPPPTSLTPPKASQSGDGGGGQQHGDAGVRAGETGGP